MENGYYWWRQGPDYPWGLVRVSELSGLQWVHLWSGGAESLGSFLKRTANTRGRYDDQPTPEWVGPLKPGSMTTT